MKKVAIMQPTYLPWIGYFALMDQVDTFVFLDDVQFDRRSWQQRNRIRTSQGELMLTVPVLKKGRRKQQIRDVLIDQSSNFPQDHIKAIELSYKKAPHFESYAEDLLDCISQKWTRMVDLNVSLIKKARERLGIETEILFSSSMQTKGAKADLLADICGQLSADVYISPVGSKNYLEASDAFIKRKIKVQYNEYKHPEYAQLHGSFMSHMAVIDLMFNVGPDSLSVIRQGIISYEGASV